MASRQERFSSLAATTVKTCNLFCSIVAKRVVARFTTHVQACIATNQVKLREYRLLLGQNRARVTLCTGFTLLAAKQVWLGTVKLAVCTDFVTKGGFVARQVWFVGDKTRNIAS